MTLSLAAKPVSRYHSLICQGSTLARFGPDDIPLRGPAGAGQTRQRIPREPSPMAARSDFSTELDFVKDLATEAAAVAMARAKRVTPVEKANLSYVTDLDQDLEKLIRRRLGEQFPDDRLTGEEYAAAGGGGRGGGRSTRSTAPATWCMGCPSGPISIGLIDDGEPVLGVIAVPPLSELYWAVKGQGAWLDGQRLQAARRRQSSILRTTYASARMLCGPSIRGSLTGRLRDLGSACCEQVFVAANRLQACTFLGEATHDVAAGVVIASEAGCALRHARRRDARRRRDGPPHAGRHAHLRRPAATARGAAAHGQAAAASGRGLIMNRVIARLPESVAELCLVRLGIQVRGLSAWLYARRLGWAIAADAVEPWPRRRACSSRKRSRSGSSTSGSCNTGEASTSSTPGRAGSRIPSGGARPSSECA